MDRYYIAQVRLGQEQAVQHAITTGWPMLSVFAPTYRRNNNWSNRPKDSEQVSQFFPRYMFVSATLPWQEIARVPGVVLVLNGEGPVEVPASFVEEMKRQQVQGHVVLSGVYETLTKLPNHERAKVLIWMFDKEWGDYAGWGEIMVAQGLFKHSGVRFNG